MTSMASISSGMGGDFWWWTCLTSPSRSQLLVWRERSFPTDSHHLIFLTLSPLLSIIQHVLMTDVEWAAPLMPRLMMHVGSCKVLFGLSCKPTLWCGGDLIFRPGVWYSLSSYISFQFQHVGSCWLSALYLVIFMFLKAVPFIMEMTPFGGIWRSEPCIILQRWHMVKAHVATLWF